MMKTIADLNALIPTLVELIRNNDHEIGESYYEQDEDGGVRCDDSTSNYLCYDEDGWIIEIYYECCGEWDNDPGDYATPSSSNLVRAMKERAQSAWGVRFEETPDSITAIWPPSQRLPDGWSESVIFIPEE